MNHVLLSTLITENISALQELRGPHMTRALDKATEMVIDTLRNGGKLLICGNGGSAAEANHLATELAGRYKAKRPSLPAFALTEGSMLTCIGNDFGFEEIFSRQIEGLATSSKDLVVAISSSGNSPNIIKALEASKRLGCQSLALLGQDGGKCKGLATHEIIAPGNSGRVAQEMHLFMIHYMCERIDAVF